MTPTRPEVTSKEAWGQLGTHTVTLPSGAVVKIRLPDLTLLLAGDAVPDHLRTVALDEIANALNLRTSAELETAGTVTTERISGLAELQRFMVSQMLVEPKFTEDELADPVTAPPAEDQKMLAELAGRERDTDARGVRIGVEPLDRWELWRQAHNCPDQCDHCAEVIDVLSSLVR